MVLIKPKILFSTPLNWFSRITQKSNIAKNGQKRWFCWRKTTHFCGFAPRAVSCFVHKWSKLGLIFVKIERALSLFRDTLFRWWKKQRKAWDGWESFRLRSWSPCASARSRCHISGSGFMRPLSKQYLALDRYIVCLLGLDALESIWWAFRLFVVIGEGSGNR